MTLGISLEELLAWSDEAANSWKSFLDSTPATLDLSCNIGGAANVQEFVRHIFVAELRWGQRLAGVPELGCTFSSHLQLGATWVRTGLSSQAVCARTDAQPAPLGATGHTRSYSGFPFGGQG